MRIFDFLRNRHARAQELADEGIAALRAGDAERGEALLERALEIDPDHVPALMELATLRFNQRRFDGAAELVSRCVEIAPPTPNLHWLRGRIRFESGDFAGAAADFEVELRRRPDDVDLLVARGESLAQLGDAAAALASFEEAMRLAPDDTRPYQCRARLRGDSDPEGALADLSAVIERDPQDAVAHFGRGFLRRARGERTEALRDFQRAVSLGRFPNDELAVQWIHELHAELAEAGGPPVQGLLRASWVEDEMRFSQALIPRDPGASAPTAPEEEGRFTIPPGYEVGVVHPHPEPAFFQTPSGVWIANLGTGTEAVDLIPHAAQLPARGDPAFVVWIFQPAMLESTLHFDRFFPLFALFVERTRGTVDHCVVAPGAGERHLWRLKRLADLGIGVHLPREEEGCFVEGHRPDGSIVIGLPGRAFSPEDAPRDMETLIADAATGRRSEDIAELICRVLAMRLVFPIVGGRTDLIPRGERTRVPEGANLQIPMATVDGMNVLVSYTYGDDPQLGDDCFETDGEAALRMVVENPGADGLVLQCRDSYLVLRRAGIQRALDLSAS